MKKNDLLEMPAIKLTAIMIQTAVKDVPVRKSYGMSYEYSRYYRAIVVGDILKIAVWHRSRVVSGVHEPDWEIYIDKKNSKWLNYSPTDCKWGEARIENIDISSCAGDYYGCKGYDDCRSRKIVNDYFYPGENKKKMIRDALLDWQKGVAAERLQYARRKELEQIDTLMNLVPKEPKDLEAWVAKEGYCKSQYMIYDRTAGKARCTACWGEIAGVKMYRHNTITRCPKCRQEVMCKSWNKQKTIEDRKSIGVLQILKDEEGYVLRVYKTCIRYKKDNDYSKEIWCYEDGRVIADCKFRIVDTFVWDQYKHNGPMRWVHEYNKGFYQYRTVDDEVVLYNKNIGKLLKNTDLKYLPAQKFFNKIKGLYIKPLAFLWQARIKPQIEVLIKVGLYKAALDTVKNHNETRIWNGQSPWGYLGISKEYFKLAVKEDLGLRHINVLKDATNANVKIDVEQTRFYAKYYANSTGRLFSLGHTEKLYKYLKLMEKNDHIRMGDYLDYLDDLRALRIPLTKDVLFPKNFEREHINVAQMRREMEMKVEQANVA